MTQGDAAEARRRTALHGCTAPAPAWLPLVPPSDRWRAVDAAALLSRLGPALDWAGVTRIGEVTHLDRIGLPVFQAVRPMSRSLAVHQGKGRCEADARISAAMEAIEGACAEAVQADGPFCRFDDPADISGTPMLIVAAVGLLVNVAGLLILRGRAGQNLNMAGAFAEVLKDALGSVGVIVAGLIIIFTGQTIADPIVSILIALLILPRTWSLLSESVNILLESAPQEIDVADLEQAMLAVDGVDAVHDSHVWSISSGFLVLSTHVVVKQGVDRRQAQRILAELTALAKGEFGIDHTTVQVEYEDLAEEEHPV